MNQHQAADQLSDCAILRTVGNSGVVRAGCRQTEEVTIVCNQYPTISGSPLQVLFV